MIKHQNVPYGPIRKLNGAEKAWKIRLLAHVLMQKLPGVVRVWKLHVMSYKPGCANHGLQTKQLRSLTRCHHAVCPKRAWQSPPSSVTLDQGCKQWDKQKHREENPSGSSLLSRSVLSVLNRALPSWHSPRTGSECSSSMRNLGRSCVNDGGKINLNDSKRWQ